MKKSKRRLHPFVMSLLLRAACLLLLSALGAIIILQSKVASRSGFILALIIFPITSLFGAFFTGRYKKSTAVAEGLISSSLISSIILLFSLFSNESANFSSVLLNIAVFIGSDLLFSYLLRPKKRRYRR